MSSGCISMELGRSESAWSPGAQLAQDHEPVGAGPRVFEVYIEDARYSTPTLLFIEVKDEQRAREFAQKKLEEDARHRGVEVRENGVRLFGVGTLGGLPSERS